MTEAGWIGLFPQTAIQSLLSDRVTLSLCRLKRCAPIVPRPTANLQRVQEYGAAGVGTVVQAHKYLFNGMDGAWAEKWTATLTASPINTGVLTNDPYSAMPCAYLVLDDDLMLPKEYQEPMAALQKEMGNVFTTYHARRATPRIPRGRSSCLELPGMVAEFADSTRVASS